MKLICNIMNKRTIELNFDDKSPTIGDLKKMLISILFNVKDINALSSTTLRQKALLCVLFANQDLFIFPDSTGLKSLGMKTEDTLTVMIQPRKLRDSNQFFYPNRTNIQAETAFSVDNGDRTQERTMQSAKL